MITQPLHYVGVYYVGEHPGLVGHTAVGKYQLGRHDSVRLFVQVDEIPHMWAYGWHETDAEDWEIVIHQHYGY